MGEIALKVAPFGVPTSVVEKLEHACPSCNCHEKQETEQKAKVEEMARVLTTQPTPPSSVVRPLQPIKQQPLAPVPPPQQYQPYVVPPTPQQPFYARYIPVKEESADILVDYDSRLDQLLNSDEYVDAFDDQQMYGVDSMEAADNSNQMFQQMFQNGFDGLGNDYGSANSTGASDSSGVTRKTGNTNRKRSNGENNEAEAEKKKRHYFTKEQREILLRHYNEDGSSGNAKLREIAQSCGLKDKQVNDWFRNRKKRLGGQK